MKIKVLRKETMRFKDEYLSFFTGDIIETDKELMDKLVESGIAEVIEFEVPVESEEEKEIVIKEEIVGSTVEEKIEEEKPIVFEKKPGSKKSLHFNLN